MRSPGYYRLELFTFLERRSENRVINPLRGTKARPEKRRRRKLPIHRGKKP
jgi:hypothetical protein